jgi:type 2A phosphatase activator TIP41
MQSFSISDWKISTAKKAILNEAEIRNLNIKNLPEMFFLNSFLKINHKTGYEYNFIPADSLSHLIKDNVKVVHHKLWNTSEHKTLPYNWTFTTEYLGTTNLQFTESEVKMDMNLLTANLPIKFYDSLVLFEDELGDNGCSILDAKIVCIF